MPAALPSRQWPLVAKPTETRIPANEIRNIRQADASIAVVGTPNSGKSTLFNRLTGLSQRIGNYPGVTVERHVGRIDAGDHVVELVDLPGTHSLSAHSIEERIAVDVVFGRMPGSSSPDGVLAILDATNLYQGLFLMQQLVELERPMVVAMTMSDAAERAGRDIDVDELSRSLGGVPVVPVVATTGSGIEALRRAIGEMDTVPSAIESWPELARAATTLGEATGNVLSPAECGRLIVDGVTEYNLASAELLDEAGRRSLDALRSELFGDEPPLAEEARARYKWVRDVLERTQKTARPYVSWRSRITDFINRPVPGTIGLFLVMAIVFQAVFAWATPFADGIDEGAGALAGMVKDTLGDGALSSLLADGIIAGVGSVVVFLPQIVILFLFIILLEDSGYLARAAYLLDRLMRSVGLSGQSIIPMISSFACAVPGIMATRVIPNRRDRIATILAAPFMTCSARLPVYALLIGAFVPSQSVGFMNLQGLVLFGLYLFGIVMGILTALVMRKSALRGPKPSFALMLPEFRRPNLQTVSIQLLGRAKVFLKRAGTVIFAVTVVVWVLSYYPRADEVSLDGDENLAAAEQMEQSWLGRAGKAVEPVFEPLGWDWRVSSAVIASFPAREVVVAVLGTVYAVGGDADEATLAARLPNIRHSDGSPVFTLPMVIGLLLFYALCLQCAATIAVIRRETNSWRWPIFAWVYMTGLGYLSALLAVQIGSSL